MRNKLIFFSVFSATASADVPNAGATKGSFGLQPAVTDAAAGHAECCGGRGARAVRRTGHRAGQPSWQPGKKSSQNGLIVYSPIALSKTLLP